LYKKRSYLHNNTGDEMEKKIYEKLVQTHKPEEKRGQNAFIAFVVGGIVGVLGQLLIEFYSYKLDISSKEASVFMIITLIFLASLFTALGFFDKWVNFAKCGLIIPITGFSHSMTSAAIEYKRDGYVTGLGANIFKLAGTVILYGIVSAYIFGLLRYFITGGV
jgi:stage V sporulation protein AC